MPPKKEKKVENTPTNPEAAPQETPPAADLTEEQKAALAAASVNELPPATPSPAHAEPEESPLIKELKELREKAAKLEAAHKAELLKQLPNAEKYKELSLEELNRMVEIATALAQNKPKGLTTPPADTPVRRAPTYFNQVTQKWEYR